MYSVGYADYTILYDDVTMLYDDVTYVYLPRQHVLRGVCSMFYVCIRMYV